MEPKEKLAVLAALVALLVDGQHGELVEYDGRWYIQLQLPVPIDTPPSAASDRAN